MSDYGPDLVARWREIGVMPPVGKMAGRYKCDNCGRGVTWLSPIFAKAIYCAICTVERRHPEGIP